MHNVADYLKIAIVGFAGVWLINKALTAAGLAQYKA